MHKKIYEEEKSQRMFPKGNVTISSLSQAYSCWEGLKSMWQTLHFLTLPLFINNFAGKEPLRMLLPAENSTVHNNNTKKS